MCNKMQRNFAKYVDEIVFNKRNLEYWLYDEVRLAECAKLPDYSDWELGSTSDAPRRLVGLFSSRYGGIQKSQLLMMLSFSEYDHLRNRLAATANNNAMRACMLANHARKNGLVNDIKKALVNNGKSNPTFMEKVS